MSPARAGDALRHARRDPADQRAAAAEQNGGFGVPEVSTHLHNFHSGPDSDGGPCDPDQQRFFFRGQYYDYYHNLRFAGWDSTNSPDGNIQEALGFLWYHDHRVDHTAENTYKGLVGPAIIFNEFDTGTRDTGFHLPSFPNYDIPLVFADKLIDPDDRAASRSTRSTRRPHRQRLPGERQGAAVPPGAEAPLPLPPARRRARRASTSSSSRTRRT
jgi:hypothetical protein